MKLFSTRRHSSLLVVAVLAAAAGSWLIRPMATSYAAQPPADEKTEDFMKIKLEAINAAMASAATDDYEAVAKAGWELVELSRQAAWHQRASATYLQDTADFVEAAEFMVRMARAEDSQGVAESYGAVAASCLACHRHVRQPKIALAAPAIHHTLAATQSPR
ncbi:MAG: hypothetical protein RIK87_15280 [Fuerstiella sp.]